MVCCWSCVWLIQPSKIANFLVFLQKMGGLLLVFWPKKGGLNWSQIESRESKRPKDVCLANTLPWGLFSRDACHWCSSSEILFPQQRGIYHLKSWDMERLGHSVSQGPGMGVGFDCKINHLWGLILPPVECNVLALFQFCYGPHTTTFADKAKEMKCYFLSPTAGGCLSKFSVLYTFITSFIFKLNIIWMRAAKSGKDREFGRSSLVRTLQESTDCGLIGLQNARLFGTLHCP